MIQIYHASQTDFTVNGIEVHPSECPFEATINGTWELSMTVPYSDDHWKDIEDNGVVRVRTPYGAQLFRIYSKDKNKFEVSVNAYPIFLDAKNDTFIYDKRPTNCDGQTALSTLLNGTKYNGHSNIGVKSTAYWIRKNVLECIGSDDDNSFLSRWGGEVRYDNYDIYIYDRIGADNGMRVEFGFNMNEIEEKIDFSSTVTRIRPVAYNGYQLPEGEFVDSPLRNKYPKDFISEITYDYIKLASDVSGEPQDGDVVCDSIDSLRDELRKAAKKEFEENQIDRPSIEYNVSVFDLSRSDKYAEFKSLLKLNLGDTVKVRNRRLDIDTTARVKSIKYDCISQRMDSLTIGDVVPSFFDKQADIQRSVEKAIDIKDSSVHAEMIKGIVNMMNTQMKAQKDNATKSDVRAILFEDTDPIADMYGALSLGTQGIQIAHTVDEKGNWQWGTAINYNSIIADYILTGVLSDKNGKFHLNMDTGELIMNDGTFKGVLNTVKDINVGAEINMQPRAEGVAQGSVWADIKAIDSNGNTLPEKVAFRSVKSNGSYVAHSIKLICGDASVSVDSDGSVSMSNGSNKVKVSKDGVDIITDNNEISLSKTSSTIKINGKTGLTGTYTVTKSVTTRSGIVTGVE
jgi:phage minor structural protein